MLSRFPSGVIRFFVVCACIAGTGMGAGILADNNQYANITGVKVSGQPDAYTFSVTIRSADSGCEQFADWWEVIDKTGRLLTRRILLHSHTGEQPFTRSGGPVAIKADSHVWIRAHMNNNGYGGDIMAGSVENGFTADTDPPDFAAGLEQAAPQPGACAF